MMTDIRGKLYVLTSIQQLVGGVDEYARCIHGITDEEQRSSLEILASRGMSDR